MTLSDDVVRDARLLTPNLSETVESLLVTYVATERRRIAESKRRIDRTIDLLNEHESIHGVWGEEFSTL